MIEPQIPPDRIQIQPENPENENQGLHAGNTHDMEDFQWLRIIGLILLTIIIVMVAFVLISDGGKFVADIVAHVSDWYEQSTINPHDTKGFTSFLRLVLTAVVIAIILYYLKKF